MLLRPFGFLVILLTSSTSFAMLSVDSRALFSCYGSLSTAPAPTIPLLQEYVQCSTECSLPCFFVDSCNGHRAAFACSSVWLLVLVVLAIVLATLLLSCCCFCCCRLCMKCMKGGNGRKREEFMPADVRRYERDSRSNVAYGSNPTARTVGNRAPNVQPGYDNGDKAAPNTSQLE